MVEEPAAVVDSDVDELPAPPNPLFMPMTGGGGMGKALSPIEASVNLRVLLELAALLNMEGILALDNDEDPDDPSAGCIF
jgi:hypothetical protein